MKKRILGLALALIMIISLLPMATFAATTKLAITLWGTEVTIDNDDATTDIPDALYWKNGAAGVPEAATAADWNISYTIVEGVPTLTLKDAVYTNEAAFLSKKQATFTLNIVYEGTNTLTHTKGTLVSIAQGSEKYISKINFIGKENAVLNMQGAMAINAAFKAGTSTEMPMISFTGGTVNLTRYYKSNYSLVKIANGGLLIEDCTMNVTSEKSDSSAFGAAIEVGDTYGAESTTHTREGAPLLTIKNSKVTINTDTPMGIAAHNVHWSAKNGVAQNMLIEGNSNVSVTVNSNKTGGNQECGISAYNVIMQGTGALEVKVDNTGVDTETALVLADTTATGPNLTGYVGQYNMYTTEGAEPVTAYAASTYFKVAFKPCTTHAGVMTDCTKSVKCTNPGCQENFYTAPANAAHVPGADDGNCLTPVKCANCEQNATAAAEAHTGGTATCTAKAVCAVCGSEYGEMLPHTGGTATCTAKAKCSVCTQEYGELAAHTPKAGEYACNENHPCANPDCDEPYRKAGTHVGGGTEATCEKKAVCKCGEEYGELAACKPAADDGDCTTAIKCSVCGKVTTAGEAAHKYTDKKDTTCDNAGCTNTRKVESGTTENPKTGDNTVLVLALSLMAASAAAFVCTKKFAR